MAQESGYIVERSSDGGTTWGQLADLPAGTTNYQHTGLTPGAARHYRVKAKGNGATTTDSDPSDIVASSTVDFKLFAKTTKQTGFAITLSTSTPTFINWGDGTQDNVTVGQVQTYTHTYAAPGEYAVKVGAALQSVGRVAVGNQGVTYFNVQGMGGVSGYLEWYSNPMQEALFGTSTGAVTRLHGYGCPNVQHLDHSGYSNLASCSIQMQDCPALETWLLPVTTGNVNFFDSSRNTSLRALDQSVIGGGFTGSLQMNGCTSLTSFILAPSYTGARFWIARAPLNRSWPLGTVIKCTDIDISDGIMSQANVNATINNLYTNRASITGTIKLTMGGTNAAPSGTAVTQIAEMRANGDTIYHTN